MELIRKKKPALTETKPKPVAETKPLTAMSSAFFAEQVEELEPAKVEAEVAPEPAKKKVMKTKLTAKKAAKKKAVKKKSTTKKKRA